MLSRVAERIYWLGRYLERAENTARLLNVYSTLLLDLPRGSRIGWHTLVDITGCKEEFDEKYQATDERSVIRFLLADAKNSAAILNSVEMARENARTTREIIPAEAWEEINNLYLFTRDNASKGVARGPRHALLKEIISRCQMIAGLLAGAMSHNSGYNFIRIARSLERADMTTRIVDVGSVTVLPELASENGEEDISEPFENTIWMCVLRSLSADQMYRQHIQDRVKGEHVVSFLLQDAHFPRSVAHCLAKLHRCLHELPSNRKALKEVNDAKKMVLGADIEALLASGLLEYIDELQVKFADIHTHIQQAWFLPVPKD
ncbi:MAG: alpha-E domain-containing protein [Pseudohongiellaceae bacterium]|nr:alpha-E domain-containing protein [Pseudohongiellaceae bacterium]